MDEARSGARIKAMRERLRLSQVELAALLGVSNVTVNRWEHDRAAPQAATLERLLRAERDGLAALHESEAARLGNVPAAQDPIIGRTGDVAEVVGRLETSRLLTVIGPGGVGKTRLALEVGRAAAARFSGGVWFVDLAALNEVGAVPHAVARLLGVRESGRKPLLDRLADEIRDRELLLILDNCEHLLGACAELAAACLAEDGESRLLATSRTPLAVPGEVVFALKPLASGDATALFVTRARARRPDFEPAAGESGMVAELCRRLDRLPLAIELAAARTHLLSLEQIVDRLDRRFELLRGQGSGAPRQRALETAIAWSYDLLEPAEAALFRRLGIFAGWFDLAAAEAVCGVDGALDLLDRLAVQSMIVVEHSPASRAARYRLLESLAAYARRWLDDSGEAAETASRHAGHYAALARGAAEGLRGPEQVGLLAALDRDYDNLLAALEWMVGAGSPDQALALAVSLARYWQRRGLFAEGSEWLTRALAREPGSPSRGRIAAMSGLALLWIAMGRLDEAEAQLTDAIALARDLGEVEEEAQAFDNLGLLLRGRGELDRAGAAHEAALALFSKIGQRRGAGSARLNLGILANLRDDHAAAERDYHEAWVLVRGTGDLAAEAGVLANLGELASRTGRPRIAADYFDRTLALLETLGDPDRTAIVAVNTAELKLTLGEFDSALALAAESAARFRELGAMGQLAATLYVYGAALAAVGSACAALAVLRESVLLYQRLGDLADAASTIEAIAGLQARVGDTTLAARLLGGAEVVREQDGSEPYVLFDYEGSVATLQAALSKPELAVAWADGRALSAAGLVAEAVNLGRVTDGEPVVLLKRVTTPTPRGRVVLTERQTEVVRLVAAGKSNREIARELSISDRTVERHLTAIYGALDVDRRSAAVAAAMARGLLSEGGS